MELSIITPYYKSLNEIKQLAKVLEPQLNENVEWLIIDDGENQKELDNLKATVIHLKGNSGNASKPRNVGLDKSKGKYIAFIDSDDSVSDKYIETILNRIKTNADYYIMSWTSKGVMNRDVIIKDMPPEWNTSIWNTVYKKELIGNNRFDENKYMGEDEDFNKRVRHGKKENIVEILYYYTSGRTGGLTMTYGTGKDYIVTSLLLFQHGIGIIGGIEKFIEEFVDQFYNKYDMILVYDECDTIKLSKLSKKIRCIKNTGQHFICDKYISISQYGNIADNVISKDNFYADMIHADIKAMDWGYNKHRKTNVHIAVSEVAKKSFEEISKEKAIVIYNLLKVKEPRKVLHLVSCTRLGTIANKEKGYDMMEKIANKMNELDIPFIWNIFTDFPQKAIRGVAYHQTTQEADTYIADSDYYISTSKTESWGYSTAQAFELGIPVISTDYEVIHEQGLQEGINGYIINENNLEEVIKKMYNSSIRGFKYEKKDNPKQWQELLGDIKKPSKDWRNIILRYKVTTNPNGFNKGIWQDTTAFDENGNMIWRDTNSVWEVDEDRKNVLEAGNAIKIIEVIPVENVEKVVDKSKKKTTTRKKKEE